MKDSSNHSNKKRGKIQKNLSHIDRLAFYPTYLKFLEKLLQKRLMIEVIILITEPGKNPYKPNSYWPIILLSNMSKVFENFFSKRQQNQAKIHKNLIHIDLLSCYPSLPKFLDNLLQKRLKIAVIILTTKPGKNPLKPDS